MCLHLYLSVRTCFTLNLTHSNHCNSHHINASAGSTIDASVDYKDFTTFLSTVRNLSGSFNTPYNFNVKDWCTYSVGSHKDWAYITGVPIGPKKLSKVGKIFKIRNVNTSQSGSRFNHRDVANCKIDSKVFCPDKSNKKSFAFLQ